MPTPKVLPPNGRSFLASTVPVFFLLVLLSPYDVMGADTEKSPVVGTHLDVRPLLAIVRKVGPMGKGHAEAVAACQALSQADADDVPEILAGMDGSNLLVANWIRGIVESIAQRQLDRGDKLPQQQLEKFIHETEHSPRARRLAYELVATVDATAQVRIIPGLLDDPSLELRRDAIAQVLAEAAASERQGDTAAAIATYHKAFVAARDKDQIVEAAAKLKALGRPVSLPDHFGFLMRWHVIAPFDNSGGQGYETVYAPEKEIDLRAAYDGKIGKVAWSPFRTTDDFGLVDFNDAFDRLKKSDGNGYADTPESTPKHKGVIGYAYTEFFAKDKRDVEIRVGSYNGHKVWVNGELVTANLVFHTNMQVDQYKANASLRKGRNTILVKLAQNEQSESWAQSWQFQLRVCDALGTAVLSTDRE